MIVEAERMRKLQVGEIWKWLRKEDKENGEVEKDENGWVENKEMAGWRLQIDEIG